jgi:hypothetical protein
METEGDDQTNLNELFVQETLDPRIESVIPILNKLSKNLGEMKEVSELAEWADSLIESPGAETLAHNQATEKSRLDAFDLDENDGGQQALNPVGIPEEDELDEAMDPEKRARLDDLIGMYRDSTDPSDYYDSEYEDPEEVLNMIRSEFGDRVASTIEAGTDKMHFPRKDHDQGYDPMSWKKPIDRQTKAGKMYKQDSDYRKNTIKARFKNRGSSAIEGVEEGILDTVKKVGGKVLDKLGHGSDEDLLKKLQKDAGIRGPNHGKPSMAQSDVEKRVDEEDMDESALQAYLGDKKYGKDGMDALRKAGQEDASEKTMQNIRAKYSNKEEVAEDGQFAGDFATGEAGQWRNKGPKANKPATVGDLVGEGQEDLDALKRLLGK